MKRNRLIITLLLVVMLTVAVTSTALANKRLYKARLSASAELHEVIDSSASGSAIVARRPQGFDFQMFVRGLSGPATAAHIHGPASETETASPVLTLCGGPAPALFATCDSVFDPATGKYQLQIQGSLSPALLRGITPAEFDDMLEAGLTYVNVHTSLNPAGETRGQLIRQ
jgi:hypothetical protein